VLLPELNKLHVFLIESCFEPDDLQQQIKGTERAYLSEDASMAVPCKAVCWLCRHV
jgi:hypothetical protein